MTNGTSSHSVKDTLRMDGEQDSSGTPPTGPSSEPSSSAGTLTKEQKDILLDDLLKSRWGGNKVEHWSEWRYRRWFVWATVKHWFGFHTYVPTEVWDVDTITFVGDRCWICNDG